jgi:hypothetical protein
VQHRSCIRQAKGQHRLEGPPRLTGGIPNNPASAPTSPGQPWVCQAEVGSRWPPLGYLRFRTSADCNPCGADVAHPHPLPSPGPRKGNKGDCTKMCPAWNSVGPEHVWRSISERCIVRPSGDHGDVQRRLAPPAIEQPGSQNITAARPGMSTASAHCSQTTDGVARPLARSDKEKTNKK